MLTDCGAKLLIHEATLADRMPDARDVPDLLHRIAVDDGGGCRSFRRLPIMRRRRRPPRSAKKIPR